MCRSLESVVFLCVINFTTLFISNAFPAFPAEVAPAAMCCTGADAREKEGSGREGGGGGEQRVWDKMQRLMRVV